MQSSMWARIAPDAKRADVVLGLVERQGPDSCAGSAVVASSRRCGREFASDHDMGGRDHDGRAHRGRCASGADARGMASGRRLSSPRSVERFLPRAAGELTVLVDGTELGWFVPLAMAANAAATASWLARREARRSRTGPRPSLWLWTAGGVGVLGVAALLRGRCESLVSVDIGAEARSIWLAHATWIPRATTLRLRLSRNSGLAASHASYPPLGGAVGGSRLGDNGRLDNARVGQLVLAILTGCAVAAVGMPRSSRSG